MFPLGHLGFGLQTAKPLRRGLPLKPLLLGTLLPDLLDKPLFYVFSLTAGTRGFGHTMVFAGVLAAAGFKRRSKTLLALALGVATHLLFDLVGDFAEGGTGRRSFQTLLWPLLGWRFPFYTNFGLHDHLHHFWSPFILSTEIIGAGLLAWEAWRVRRPSSPRR